MLFNNCNITLYNDSVENILKSKSIIDSSIDAVLSDPPYGLSFMNHKWDYDVPNIDVFKLIYTKLKSGAHLLSFGGSRTHHRLMCNIEDAGFTLKDCIFWLHSNGFPKSYNISKGIDKNLKSERAAIGKRVHPTLKDKNKTKRLSSAPHDGSKGTSDELEITEQSTEHAKLWNGYGTALKPAYEPIIVSMKPVENSYAQNAIKYGVGGLNINKCRVPIDNKLDASQLRTMKRSKKEDNGWGMNSSYSDNPTVVHKDGRFPSNIIMDEEIGLSLNFDNNKKVSRFFYCAKPSKKENGTFNDHPTVKPIMLTTYLSKLILPPEDGVILIPYSGSGTEIIGAINAGWKNIIAIEREKKYIDIAEKRINNLGFSLTVI